MNTDRLETLATFLEQFPQDYVDKNKFNLGAWMVSNEAAYKNFHVRPTIQTSPNPFKKTGETTESGYHVVEPNECQTVGCAMGWATTIPEFKALGLRLIMIHEANAIDLLNPSYQHITIEYQGIKSIDAIVKFFDIDKSTSYCLFIETYYSDDERTDPRAVATKIRRLILLGEQDFVKSHYSWY